MYNKHWCLLVWPGTNWDRKLLGCFELLSLLWFWKIRQETLKQVVYDFWPDKKGRNSSLCTSGRLIWSFIGRSHPWRELLSISSCLFRENLWTYCHCTLLELMFLIYNWCQVVPATSIMTMGYIMGLFQFNNELFLVASMS